MISVTCVCEFFLTKEIPLTLVCYNVLVIPYFFYCSSVWDPFISSTNAEILKKTQHFAQKICSQKWDTDFSSLSQLLTFWPSKIIALFPNYVFSIKSLTTSSTSFQYFHLQTSAKLCFSPFWSSHLYHSFFSLICFTKLIYPFCSLSLEFTSLSCKI